MCLPFDTPAALELNALRWSHFLSLGIAVSGLSVLEPGAGTGHFTRRLLDAGARRVTILEGRAENVRLLRERCPEALAVCVDLEQDCYSYGELDDLCFCYGLLYHLKDPQNFLGRLKVPLLVLETIVQPVGAYGQEWHGADAALGDHVYRPALPELEGWLRALWPHVYRPAPPKHAEFVQTWPLAEGCQWGRVVYVAANQPLALQEA